jgi:hypothetical protein
MLTNHINHDKHRGINATGIEHKSRSMVMTGSGSSSLDTS